jgi:hypothetical protein
VYNRPTFEQAFCRDAGAELAISVALPNESKSWIESFVMNCAA